MADHPDSYAIPSQQGKLALVTGANSGLGYHTARRLAGAGASIIMACRDPQRGKDAVERLTTATPGADVTLLALDLASLGSVAEAADEVRSEHQQLDLLINNAGVMAIPRGTTADGFERQIGTNHLGHFALTGRLIDLLTAAPASRVVTVSSNAHRSGRVKFDDLQREQGYGKWRAYGQSKLANLLFAFELQRRLTDSGADTLSVAVHPGWSATHLQTTGRGVEEESFMAQVWRFGNRIIAQSDEMGALPTLHAATSDEVAPGGYYGPSGLGEVRGMPKQVGSSRRSRDEDAAARLWAVSEELTGVTYTPLGKFGR